MDAAGLSFSPQSSAGLSAEQPSSNQPAMTMSDRANAIASARMANPGLSYMDAARLLGLPEPAYEAPEVESDPMGRLGMAWTGLLSGLQSRAEGAGRMASDYLPDILPGDWTDSASKALGEFVGPSEERMERFQEAQLTPEGKEKGFGGKLADVVTAESLNTLTDYGTAALAGGMAGKRYGGKVGFGIGLAVGLFNAATRQYDEAAKNRDEANRARLAAEKGIAPEEVPDEEVRAAYTDEDRARVALATAPTVASVLPIGTFLSKLPGGNKIIAKTVDKAVQKRNRLVATGQAAGTVGVLEGGQEMLEELAIATLTEQDTIDALAQLDENDASRKEITAFLVDQLGERVLLAGGAGFLLGGIPGAYAGNVEQKARNEIATERTERLGEMAKQRGSSLEDLEATIKAGKSKDVAVAARDLETAQRQLVRAERDLAQIEEQGAPEEVLAPMREFVEKRTKQLDELGDDIGKRLGIDGWMSKVDADKVKAEQERVQHEEAQARLDTFGLRANPGVSTETMRGVADRLERADGRVEKLTNRVEAITDGDRKAEAQKELEQAKADRQKAKIEAKVKLQGLTPTQAVAQVKRDDSASEKERRQQQQRDSREKAVQRQSEIEFPDTMSPEQRKARAQEIIAENEADGKTDRGLEKKLSRLRRQRRGATSEEEIDRITNEIADLEARRGLPTPAVEAARRVLQDQGELSQAGLGEQSPEAGTAEAEVGSTVSTGEDTETANSQEPAGKVEGPVAQEPASEPAGAAARARAKEEISRWIEDPEVLTAHPDLEEQVAGYIQDRANALTDGDVTQVEAFDMLSDFQDNFRDGDNPDPNEYFGARIAARAYVDRDLTETKAEGYPHDGKPFRDLSKELKNPKTTKAAEKAMRDWTARTGFEAAAHIKGGKVIGIGTNDHPSAVMPLVNGVGDMSVTFTHTHPQFTPFSTSDFGAMMQDPQPFRAILPEGEIQATPLKALTRPEFMKLNRAMFVVMDAVAPKGSIDPLSRDRIRQEAMSQALEDAGVISYDIPFQNLTPQEREYVNTVFEALSGPIATLRGRIDGRPGIEETGSLWRDPGERRAEDAAMGAETQAPDPFAELELGPDPFGDIAEDAGDAELDTELGLDNRVLRSSQRSRKPNFNPERVTELGNSVVDYLGGLNRSAILRKVYEDGRLTREGIDRGIAALLNAHGNKKMFAVMDAAKAMFPGYAITEADVERRIKRKGKADSDKPYKHVKKDKKDMLTAALALFHAVEAGGHGGFMRVKNFAKNRHGQPIPNYFHRVSDELAEFVGFEGPESAWFDKPMADPKDTSKLKRDPRNNLFSEDALAPARRTAEYLQANRYTIDGDYLQTIEPRDLISKKALGADGHKVADLDRWLALDETPEATWTADDRAFRSKYWKLGERLKTAEYKLESLKQAYENFVEKNGKDAEVGFMYQVDNRSRIYADGSFHPQAGGKIKGLFVHEGMPLREMTEVDNSASGWQINALMARDEVMAPHVNMGRGQATEPGYTKEDIYTDTIKRLEQKLREHADRDLSKLPVSERADAAGKQKWARIFLDHLYPGGKSIMEKNTVKRPIIAMNYGGDEGTFRSSLVNAVGPAMPNGFTKANPGAWSWLSNLAMQTLEDRAPASVKLQAWAIDAVDQLVAAVEAGSHPKDPPKLQFSVGLNGRVAVKKGSKFEWETRVNATRFDGSGDEITVRMKSDRDDVNSKSTGRAVWANNIQAFDAAVLHRAVERYKVATNGAFVTTNHDSFTVPPQYEGQIASAVRESMGEIMERIDVPNRLYEEIMSQARIYGVEDKINVEPFDAYGSYNFDDLQTSTPLFGEREGDPRNGGEDFVPNYAELPEAGRLPEDTIGQEEGTIPGEDLQARADRVREQAAANAERRAAQQAVLAGEQTPEPAPRFAIDVANYMEQLPETKGLVEKVQDIIHEPAITGRTFMDVVEDNIFNAFAPIRRLEVAMKGELPTGAESAFKSAEMAVNDSGRQEMLLHYGAAKLGQHGEYTVDPDTKGLFSIFKMAGGIGEDRGQRLQDWMQWMVARRAEDLHAKGIKTPLTQQDIAAALAKGRPEFQQAADEWKKHNDANLRFLRDTGRINDAQMDAMMDDEFYVPFYRSDERLDGRSPDLKLDTYTPGVTQAGILRRDPGIKKIIGGDKLRIQNLMQNMIRNSQAMVSAGMRNRAANMSFELMEQAGLAHTVPISANKPSENAVRMWEGGTEKWVVPEGNHAYPMMTALAGLTPVQLGRIMQIFADIGSIFRQGITITPPFMIRNAIRGAVSTGILTTGANMTVANNTLTGMVDALGKGPATNAFKAQSGMGDFRFGNSDIGFGKNDILIDFGMAKHNVFSLIRKMMNGMEQLGTATELADRVAAYNTMIERGIRPDEAAYQALSIMNYGRKGGADWLRSWLPLVPFMNARLQGYSRLTEGAVGRRGPEGRKQAFKQMILNGLVYTLGAAALWGWNHEDDERREKYEAEPLYRRLNYHIIFVGDKTYYIPKAFELGAAFTSIPELFADRMLTDLHELGPGARKIVQDTVAFNFIPAALQPIIEMKSNFDWFRQQPIEGLRESSLKARDRTQNASSLAVFVGQQLGISDATKVSPAMITHFFQGYGGAYYVFLSTMFDTLGQDLGLAPKSAEPVFGDIPFVTPALSKAFGAFVRDTDMQTTRFVEEFYKTKDHVTQIYRSAKTAREAGDFEYARKIMEQAPKTTAAYKRFNKTSTDLSKVNARIRLIRQDRTMSRKEKEEKLRPLLARRHKLTRSAAEVARKMEEQQGISFKDAS